MLDVPRAAMEQPAAFWSLERAAEHYGCSVKTVRRMIASGEITGYRVGKRMIRVAADEISVLARRIPAADAS